MNPTISHCEHCKKRSHIIEKCKCDRSFCLKHLQAEKHMCTFDYKLRGVKVESAAVPVKLETI
jgi:predicted nucleic acid binding AN1-type Zn finger protein